MRPGDNSSGPDSASRLLAEPSTESLLAITPRVSDLLLAGALYWERSDTVHGIRSYAYIPFHRPPGHAVSVSREIQRQNSRGYKEAFNGHLVCNCSGRRVDRDFSGGLMEGLQLTRSHSLT